MSAAARLRVAIALVLLLTGAALASLATSADATFGGRAGRIAFTDYTTGQLYAVNPDGTGLRQLTHGKEGSFAESASWSPDGKHLIYAFAPTPETPPRIWMIDANGRHAHPVGKEAAEYRDLTPAYGPGGVIVFARCQPGDGVCAIWSMRTDGSHRRALTPYRTGTKETVDFDPVVSPSGKQVAFTRFYAGGVQSQIFVIGIDGGHPRAITPPALEANAPDWSPNGRLIAFGTNSQRVGSTIHVVKPDGSGLRQVTPDRYPANAIGPVFSPRGNALAFADDSAYSDHCCFDLRTVYLDGTHEAKVAPALKGLGMINPAWGTAPLLRP